MTETLFPGSRYGMEYTRNGLSLRFDARLETIEGVLALTQNWADKRNFSRDDKAGLRLLLEELLLNIRFHAASNREGEKPEDLFVTLQLELLSPQDEQEEEGAPAKNDTPLPPDRLRITLQDSGVPFDPQEYEPEQPASLTAATAGGRGLSLVRLFSVNRSYRRTEGRNVLSLELLLGGAPGAAQTAEAEKGARPARTLPPRDAWHALRRAWREKLALRQTILFTASAILLFWSGVGVYYATVATMRARSTERLAMQSMATQDELSRAFLRRVEGGLTAFVRGVSARPEARLLLDNSDALLAVLRQGDFFRPFTTETPVIGITLGRTGQTGAWLFHLRGPDIVKTWLPEALDGMHRDRKAEPRWQGPVFHIPDERVGRHAAMFFGLPVRLSGVDDGFWLGVIIGMPWIEDTLRGLSGFAPCEPIFTNDKGEYVIYPPGRSALQGPRSIFEDASQNGLPALAALGRRMVAGEQGLLRFEDGLETKAGAPVWPLPWKQSSSLLYYPMGMPGWRFAMAVPDAEIGNALPALPWWLVLAGVLGPAFLGAVTWVVTSRTLRPLRQLASALENLSAGDLDTPFPEPRIDDEIGRMMDAFERTRIILKASFRSQARGATAQQRMRNELALARGIQKSMLPDVFPAVPGLDIAAHVDMARDVCGDLYDCFAPDPARPDLVACVMGDVCGKGVPAALVMSRVMPLVRSALLRGLSPARALEMINAALLRQDTNGMFVSMLIGIFDSKTGVFSWACAGHPPPMPGPAPEEEPNPDPPPWSNELVLGVKTWTYSERRLCLSPGQSLLLYTDGADEAMGPDPAAPAHSHSTEGFLLYGEDRLAQSFIAACRAEQNSAGPPAAAIMERVRNDILAHMADTPPFDDITLMVLSRKR